MIFLIAVYDYKKEHLRPLKKQRQWNHIRETKTVCLNMQLFEEGKYYCIHCILYYIHDQDLAQNYS